MPVTVNFRLFDFPSKIKNEQKSVSLTTLNDESLYEKIAESLGVSPQHISIYFRGKRIKSSNCLSDLGFQNKHTVQVLFKPVDVEEPTLDVNPAILTKSMAALHALFHHRPRTHRIKHLFKFLTNPSTLRQITNEAPGLKNDTLALDILRNPCVFMHVVDPNNAGRILETNKSLAAAIILVYKAIKDFKNEENAHEGNHSMPSEYFLRFLEEEDIEDMEVDSNAPTTSRQPRRSARTRPAPLAGGGFITSNQLAQALTMANSPQSGPIFPSPASTMQSPQTTTDSSASGGEPAVITPDIFSVAMQQAMAHAAPPASQQEQSSESLQQLSPEVMERGLEQLRGMGITDEAASREALLVARGNVETAVNILFSSGLHDL